MRALNEKQTSWLIGPKSTEALSRLWARYRSLYLGQGLETQLQTLTFQQLRLVSLGVNVEQAHAVKALTPSLINDPQLLSAIETTLKDNAGRSLQKIFVDDISSRILVDAATSAPESSQWCNDALKLMAAVVPHHSQLFTQMISLIIPIYHEKYDRPFRRGFSHIDYLGALFTTFVERKATAAELRRTILAADFSHEMGHQALMLYQLSDEVLLDHKTPIYSSVRKVSRPAIMALHACVASAYMMEVFEGVLHSDETAAIEKEFSENSLAELCFHQKLGIDSLKAGASFSEVGQLLLGELEAQLNSMTRFTLAKPSEQTRLSYFGILAP
jgi:hypothetical protein